jgi:hypothetical protein
MQQFLSAEHFAFGLYQRDQQLGHLRRQSYMLSFSKEHGAFRVETVYAEFELIGRHRGALRT